VGALKSEDFKNCLFMNVRSMPRAMAVARIRSACAGGRNRAEHNTLAAKSCLAFGSDPIEELTKLAEVIHKEASDSISFTSKLILKHDYWYTSAGCTTKPRRRWCDNCICDIPTLVLPMRL
jgi:hypothetical protein